MAEPERQKEPDSSRRGQGGEVVEKYVVQMS